MAHDHDHQHGSYYLDQLLIIAFCGAFGVIMILLKQWNVLPLFLDQKFHEPLVWGAVALLVLVVIRAASLWMAVGQAKNGHEHEHQGTDGHSHDLAHEHGHGHDHDHTHEHDHAHCHDHDHSCEHDHGHEHAHGGAADCGHEHDFAPWRYVVLMIPIVLFLFRLPWPDPPEDESDKNVIPLKLAVAEQSAADEQMRESWKEKMKTESVRLKGKFTPLGINDRMFSFVKLRMTCCFADAYGEPVKVFVESPTSLDFGKLRAGSGWVKVTGKLNYQRLSGGEYVAMVKADEVRPIPTPANQFDN